MLNIATPSTITGKVLDTKRVGYSTVGNPNWEVTILLSAIDSTPVEASADALRTVVVKTTANSSIGYGIDNPEFRHSEHTFKLNAYGRIASASAATAAAE